MVRNARLHGRLSAEVRGPREYPRRVLDLRVYRAAFGPALIALLVVAFSLVSRPAPSTTPLAGDAFDGLRAFGGRGTAPPRDSLRELARAFPARRPGSAGDAALADRVAASLRGDGFEITRTTASRPTIDGRAPLDTVVGVRAGVSSRRIVVLAHRDAAAGPAAAELSGTAALLELARVFAVREARKTIVLVSTSGGSGGAAGAQAWARSPGGPVDAVLVLGDMAAAEPTRPWVVDWSNDRHASPLGLRRTVDAAFRAETGRGTGMPRGAAQWLRRAVPLTVGEQGAVAAAGLPAVLLSASGERPPGAREPVSPRTLELFGRVALRTVTAIDQGGSPPAASSAAAPGPASRRAPTASWPPARSCPRGPCAGSSRRCCCPPCWRRSTRCSARAAGASACGGGWRGPPPRRSRSSSPGCGCACWRWRARCVAPPAPVLPAAVPLDARGAAALASAALVLVAAWWWLLPRLRAAAAPGAGVADGGTAAAAGVWLCGVTCLVWLVNPWAAALLVPACHVWLFLVTPGTRLRGPLAVTALAAGLLLPALCAVVLRPRARRRPARRGLDGAARARGRPRLARRRARRLRSRRCARERARHPARAARDRRAASARATSAAGHARARKLRWTRIVGWYGVRPPPLTALPPPPCAVASSASSRSCSSRAAACC